MAKADLHVHSIYSEHPSEWFLQRVGAAESYTDPEFVYKEAKKRGMTFVTITDHNRIDGALKLKEKYPNDVFVGLEATTYFPEDKCKIHLLIYGLNKAQFEKIQKFRKNIYELRDYIKEQGLVYSVAHATYSVNNKLTIDHLEKLLLLFDCFEVINGGRNKINNQSWSDVLFNLTPEHIEELKAKHNIKPIGSTPWIKRMTGGSDDHAGLFIGKTYTEIKAESVEDYLNELKTGNPRAYGRHNNYQSLAFTIYKIAYEFSRSKSKNLSGTLISQLTEYIFENKKLSWKDRFRLKRFRKGSDLKKLITELVRTLSSEQDIPTQLKINYVYTKISEISDEYLLGLFRSFETSFKEGDFFKIIRNLSSTIPSLFLIFPFITTLKHMFKNRQLLEGVRKRFDCVNIRKEKTVLWFSDTVEDLNGVAITIENIRKSSELNKRNISIVGPEQFTKKNNYIGLKIIHSFRLPFYEKLKIEIPSFLLSLEKIYIENPDEIIISTPGPIGLIGFVAAKLLNIKCTGIYHTDFASQAKMITDDDGLVGLVDQYINWFYHNMDKIFIPTNSYKTILENKGYDSDKMFILNRRIDRTIFYHRQNSRKKIQLLHNLNEGKYYLYAGRVSKDKSIEIGLEAFVELQSKHDNIYFLVVGDGPYLLELQARYRKNKKIIFVGRIAREDLPNYYSACDLFVFPSQTDTFGLVVLEAQACNLPVLVANAGGPKEIVENSKFGVVVKNQEIESWEKEMEKITDSDKTTFNTQFKMYSSHESWDTLVDEIIM